MPGRLVRCVAEGCQARSHEDESWRRGLTEEREEGLCYADGADNVDIEGVKKCITSDLIATVDASIVHEDVDPSVVGIYFGSCGINGLNVGDFDLYCRDLAFDAINAFQRLYGRFAFGRITATEDDVVVGRGGEEFLCCLESQTLIGACEIRERSARSENNGKPWRINGTRDEDDLRGSHCA
jgi:hypothetical protein